MNQKNISTTILVVAISVLVTIGVMISIAPAPPTQTIAEPPKQGIVDADEPILAQTTGTDEIREISSEEELRDILVEKALSGYKDTGIRNRSLMMFDDAMMSESAAAQDLGKMQADSGGGNDGAGSSYSATNIQVQNVDEPDYIKNDSKYVYIVSQNTLSIIDAYPAESAEVILKVALDIKSRHIENIFLNNDRLVIFYNSDETEQVIPEYDYIPRNTYNPVTHALIIDISDRERPAIIKDYTVDGYFRDARMIDNYVYFVTNSYIDYQHPRFPIILEGSAHVMTPDVFYFDSDVGELSNFNTLTAIDIFGDTINSESFLVGYSGTFYVSANNFYLTYQKETSFRFYEDATQERFFDVIVPLLPEDLQVKIKEIQDDEELSVNQGLQWIEIAKAMQATYDELGDSQREALLLEIQDAVDRYDIEMQEKTQRVIIQKIAIDKDDIQHVATGSVPGRLLNQFSMDENQDRFRVATTMEYYTEGRGLERANGVYVLDEELEIVGELEKIAPDESIFSARFIDDRLYLVTFQQIDPFFVIDLAEDTPRILGELKMPGFSNYLHPYDEEHVIGLGRETTLTDNDRVRELGVKIALFNVADVSNPRLVDTVIIGDKNRVESSATYDHKAFFFDPAREILSIPIHGDARDLGDVSSSKRVAQNYIHWEGFYVYDLDQTDGFNLKGIITHAEIEDGYYYYYYGAGGRTFYIDDVLYTVTAGGYLKMNALDDDNLQEINSIKLEDTGRLLEYIK